MIAIAIWANLLVAHTACHTQGGSLVMILPLVMAVAFFLIVDIGAPRRGLIRGLPQNLLSLAQSFHGN
jgi:hypothetical protein